MGLFCAHGRLGLFWLIAGHSEYEFVLGIADHNKPEIVLGS